MKTSKEKIRLDLLLLDRGLTESREQARGFILAGKVLVDNQIIDKAGFLVGEDSEVSIKQSKSQFVSRAGDKLDAAISYFEISVEDKIALDVGSSTGGFTDCLLKRDSSKVYCVDVGRAQLHNSLRMDPRVVVMEGVNARYLTNKSFPDTPEVLTIDVSFISVRKLLPAIVPCLSGNAQFLILVKPQFELSRELVGKGGVIKNESDRSDAVKYVAETCEELGLLVIGEFVSPVPGKKKGNVEIFIYARKTRGIKE